MREIAPDGEAAADIEDRAPTPDIEASDHGMWHLLQSVIERLSLERREIPQLAYHQEFSVQEIAELLDLPEDTVKTRMSYARQRLTALLDAAGVTGAIA